MAGACAAVFLAMNWLPGDPAHRHLSLAATPAQEQAERVRLGLDAPPLTRLWNWFDGAAHGSLGRSWATGQPVTGLLAHAGHNSAWLVGVTFAVAVPLLCALAVACGLRPGGLVDRLVLAVGAATTAIPPFVIGVLVLLVFSARLGWLPALSSPDPARPMLAQFDLLLLPVTVLGLGLVAYLSQVVRAQVITVTTSPFVEAARLRGVTGRALLWRHVLPSVAPVTGQLAAIAAITLTTETVVVEAVFAYPGIGSLLKSAVADKDLPVVQGIALVLAALVVATTMGSTALTTMLNPRGRDASP